MARAHAFCSVFDRNYAARAGALYHSLERQVGDFRLVAVCMDRDSQALLDRLDAPRLTTVGVAELEQSDPEFAETRPTRSAVEYCWTAVPAACRYVLLRDRSLEAITYVDADVYLFSSPQPLFDELGDGSILIVRHRTNDARDELAYGLYNVGWITLRSDANAIAALEWWRERCIEWCYARVEPGRFGDQKYLDEWPARFPGVVVSANPGAGLAPWNQTLHEIAATADGSLSADGRPVVFFHYSGLTLHPAGGALGALALRSGAYRATGPFVWTIRARHRTRLLDLVWAPYVERCAEAHADLVAAGAPPTLGLERLTARGLAATVAREWAPASLRDVHLGLRRHLMTRRAGFRRPDTDSALPRG